MFGLEKLFGGGNQSSASSYADSSVNTNTETSGQGINASGGSIAARDGSTVISGGMTVNTTTDLGVVEAALGSVNQGTGALRDIANNAIGASAGSAKSVMDAAGSFVDANARMASQSMDTALEFARNAKPASATFTDAIPFIAVAAAVAAIGYALVSRK